jgi:hypothetical protein
VFALHVDDVLGHLRLWSLQEMGDVQEMSGRWEGGGFWNLSMLPTSILISAVMASRCYAGLKHERTSLLFKFWGR